MARPIRNGLNMRQLNFVAEYLKDFKSEAAAIRAGYAPKNAAITASKLLSHPKVMAELEEGIQRWSRSLDVTVERIVNEYARIAFFSWERYTTIDEDSGQPRIDWTLMDKDGWAAIEGIEQVEKMNAFGNEAGSVIRTTKVKLANKNKALADLARYKLMFAAEEAAKGYGIGQGVARGLNDLEAHLQERAIEIARMPVQEVEDRTSELRQKLEQRKQRRGNDGTGTSGTAEDGTQEDVRELDQDQRDPA